MPSVIMSTDEARYAYISNWRTLQNRPDVLTAATASTTNGKIKILKQDSANVDSNYEVVVYTHPTTDGNKHVPETSTTHNGHVLVAGSSAGSFAWKSLADANIVTTNTTQTISGTKTFSATITGTRAIFTSTTDAASAQVNAVALILGDSTATHLELDNNEILAKTGAATVGNLYLNENAYITSSGGFYTSGGTITTAHHSIYAGTDGDTTREINVRCCSGAGTIYLYSVASETGNRGIYVPAHGTGAAKNVILVDTNNNVTFNGSLSGNASTASSAAKLTTARTLTIGGTGKTFDGSGNVSWSLSEIGAAAASHSHSYIPLSGSTAITGNLGINTKARGLYLTDSSGSSYAAIYDNGSNLWIGSTQQGTTTRVHTGQVYINAGWTGSEGNSTIFVCVPTSVTGGGSSYSVLHSGNYTSWTVTKTGSGASGTWGINVTGSSGSCTGNAATASSAAKLTTARTLTIGGTGKTFDGSGNVSWSKAEILGSSTNANFYRGDQTWSNTLNGAFTANGTITANGGYLKSTLNSNTVQIGSQNTDFCHITNSAAIPFWFNQDIQMEKGKVIGGSGTQYRPFQIYLGRNTTNSNTLNAATPLIEFSNSDRSQYCQLIYSDYDSVVAPDSLTLLGNQAGTHFIAPKINAGGYINNSYAMSTASFICNSWVRSVGSTGWYNETHGGGWYMTDDTWIRSYNNKSVYVNTGELRCDGSTWGGKLRMTDNWLGFYAASGSTGTRYGYIQCNADRMYFRKENSTSGLSYYFDFGSTVQAPTFRAGNDAATYTTATCKVYAANGTISIHSSTNRGVYEHTDGKWIIYLQNSDDTVHSGYKIYDAVWNDFAEMREGDIVDGGYAVYDDGHGKMKLCTERMQPGSRITSDTFGIVVGCSETAKTPIGVAGRVLVYPAQPRENYHVGDAVCAAPEGKLDLMTREEIMAYPDRILGIVSEIPDYEIWNQRHKAEEEEQYTETNIPVNGRIWIYVR